MNVPPHYHILGLEPSATEAEVRSAYRRLAKKYHPDANRDDPDAEEKFKRVSAAYKALSDPHSRQMYDRLHATASRMYRRYQKQGEAAVGGRESASESRDVTEVGTAQSSPSKAEPVAGKDAHDGSRMDAGSQRSTETAEKVRHRPAGGRRRSPRPNAPVEGRNIQMRLRITLAEAYNGGTRQVKYLRDTACSICGGSGVMQENGDGCSSCEGTGIVDIEFTTMVTIPPGTRQGDEIRCVGAGHTGTAGTAGDLLASIMLRPDRYLEVNRSDLQYIHFLGLDQFIEGGEIRVPTPAGTINLTIPPRFPDGKSLKIKGKGLPGGANRRTGDIIVRVEHCLPLRLSKKEREMVGALMQSPGFNPPADADGFFPRDEE